MPFVFKRVQAYYTSFQRIFAWLWCPQEFTLAYMPVFPLLILLVTVCWGEEAFGTWKMNPARSTLAGDHQTKSLTLKIEPHAKGEVFTLDRIEVDGRTTTSSTILYFDGQPRDFEGLGCSGTQSSRRLDSRTVEILHKCGNGKWIRFVRHLSAQPEDLVLEITKQQSDGRRFERRLVLKKQ
jgi:hypothetical protein